VREWALTLPSGLPFWELESLWSLKFSKSDFRVQNSLHWKISIYHWKSFKMQMSKMGSHDPFEYLQHKLWLKEGLRIKMLIWLLTIKSPKSP
jgi:hypothetical protein